MDDHNETAPCRWMRRHPKPMTAAEIRAALYRQQDNQQVRALMDLLTATWQKNLDAVQAHPMHGGRESREYDAGSVTALTEFMGDALAMIETSPEGDAS